MEDQDAGTTPAEGETDPATETVATDGAAEGTTPEAVAADAAEEDRKAWEYLNSKHPTEEAKGKAYREAENTAARLARENEALRQAQERSLEPAPEDLPDEAEVADIEADIEIARNEQEAVVSEINGLVADAKEKAAQSNRLQGRLDETDPLETDKRAGIQRQIDELARAQEALRSKYDRATKIDYKRAQAKVAKAEREKTKLSHRTERAQKSQEDAEKGEAERIRSMVTSTINYIDAEMAALGIKKEDQAACHDAVREATAAAVIQASKAKKTLNIADFVSQRVRTYRAEVDRIERRTLKATAEPNRGAAATTRTPGGGGGSNRTTVPARDPNAPKLMRHELAREGFINAGRR